MLCFHELCTFVAVVVFGVVVFFSRVLFKFNCIMFFYLPKHEDGS